MKRCKSQLLFFFFLLSLVVLLTSCSRSIIPTQDDIFYEGIAKTDYDEELGLKQFEVCEIESENNNIYKFLKFKNAKVANKKDDTYYSQSSALADMYVKVIEDIDPAKNSIKDVVDATTSYIEKNITDSKYQENGNIAYKIIKYNIFSENKYKIVVCSKSDNGYLLHDFSFFEETTYAELEFIKECIQDIWITFGISIEDDIL